MNNDQDMDAELFAAEILAVTGGQKKDADGESDASDSDGEFGAVADSGDDDGMDDIGDEDDEDSFGDDDDDDDDIDDDDEDDDDDDDYGAAESKKKTKTRKAPVKKAAAPKRRRKDPARTKGTAKGATRRKGAPVVSDDDDDEIFEHEFDEDGYGDSADRDRLARMTEVERETLLSERVDNRKSAYDMWVVQRDIQKREAKRGAAAGSRTARSSSRAKLSSKSDALQVLAADKRKKSTRQIEEVSDADSEPDGVAKRSRERNHIGDSDDDRDKEYAAHDDDLGFVDAGPELQYRDVVPKEGTPRLCLNRMQLVTLSQQPYFLRAVKGLFTRIKIGDRSGGSGSYLMSQIEGLQKGKTYEAEPGKRTNYLLKLRIGKAVKDFQIIEVSGSKPSEEEFAVFRTRTLDAGLTLPSREEVKGLMKQAGDVISKKLSATDEEYKRHLTNMEALYPERINWTQKRAETQTALEIKKQELENARIRGRGELSERLAEDVQTLGKRMQEIEDYESKYMTKATGTAASLFQNLARKNLKFNSVNDRLAASRRSLEVDSSALVDPFARFDTTGQSYYSIGKKSDAVASVGDMPSNRPDRVWKSTLKSYNESAPKTKLSETAHGSWGMAVPGLAEFFQMACDDPIKAKLPGKLCVPGVDAVYADQQPKPEPLPAGTKVISFEEWMRMRNV